jgi:hypothetical protein
MSAIKLNKLDDVAFRAILADPMKDVTKTAQPQFDIWPYVKSVPSDDFIGHEIWEEFVECVYRTPDDRFDLVHVCTRTPNVFLVIVVDLIQHTICGHHLLDLNQLYGLSAKS